MTDDHVTPEQKIESAKRKNRYHEDEEFRERCKRNNRRSATRTFLRTSTYDEIVEVFLQARPDLKVVQRLDTDALRGID